MTFLGRLRDREPRAGDGGFTMIELMVAIGVFGSLMAVVGAATISGFEAIREADKRAAIQTESQNAMEYAGRLLRYAKAPDALLNVMPEATASAVTVFTYPGTGFKEDVPYKARIYAQPTADGGTSVVSDVWTPSKAADGTWQWTDTNAAYPTVKYKNSRVLLRVPKGSVGSPIKLTYYACTPTAGCAATRRQVTPPVSGPLTLAALEVPESIVVSIGDPAIPGSMVTQSVKLVNQA